VITNFGTLGWTISTSYLFSKFKTSKSKQHFFKEAMATKNFVSQVSKNTRSLSRRSCQADTIPKRWVHGLETRSMAKAITVVVLRQIATPSPKQQDLQQKVSSWMDKAKGHSKLPTPLCEVEGYYSSYSSSPSLKQVFQSETKAESSKTVIMLVDNRYKQLGREDGFHKGHARKAS